MYDETLHYIYILPFFICYFYFKDWLSRFLVVKGLWTFTVRHGITFQSHCHTVIQLDKLHVLTHTLKRGLDVENRPTESKKTK